MWRRGAVIEPERASAWLQELGPALETVMQILSRGASPVVLTDGDVRPIGARELGNWFGSDETVGSAAFATLDGEEGLLAMVFFAPTADAIGIADSAFAALASALGTAANQAWMLVDMRTAIAETMAAQAEALGVQAAAHWRFVASGDVAFDVFFIPSATHWGFLWEHPRREAA